MSRQIVLTVSLLAASHLWWVFRAIFRDLERVNDEADDPYPQWSIIFNAFVCIGAYAAFWFGLSVIVLWVFR